MSEWQPIDTAPRDGTDILLFCRFDGRDEIKIAKWSDEQTYEGPFGQFRWKESEGLIAERIPTHWMPLPVPPIVND